MKLQTLPHGATHTMTSKVAGGVPLLPVSITSMEALISQGFDQTTKGKFDIALGFFQESLRSCALIAVTS